MAKKGQKFQKYELAFKINLVKLYLEGAGSLKGLTKEYGLKDSRQLRNWIKKYQAGELIEGSSDKRGQSSGSKRGASRKKFADREDELSYLKLENEYLKKNCWRKANRRPSLQICGHQRI